MASVKQVLVGGVPVGGGARISVQSMTNTDTRDIEATSAQIHSLESAGCDIVRVSVYDMDCALALKGIKDAIHIPLVADIHFDYRLAIAALENGADKLRFNPGNIGEAARVKLLADCARSHNVPIRVGVNGGSLEKDLLEKYGRPSAEAMVESALHHVRLLEEAGFYDIVISIKSSSVLDTVNGYRLLSKSTEYPLHVGLTEAGMGNYAIVKSAVCMGALLVDGIGDTIRVSLTGDPVDEVYTAIDILCAAGLRSAGVEIISCPTCGRCRVELLDIVTELNERLCTVSIPVKIAVMGCAVNGPGEAKGADIGIAFGEGNGVLFKHGVKLSSGPVEEIINKLILEVNNMANQ